jgi:hypothetical protein
VTEKIRSKRLAWYGHVIRRDESHITKRVMSINVDGHPRRGRPKKRWMDGLCEGGHENKRGEHGDDD